MKLMLDLILRMAPSSCSSLALSRPAASCALSCPPATRAASSASSLATRSSALLSTKFLSHSCLTSCLRLTRFSRAEQAAAWLSWGPTQPPQQVGQRTVGEHPPQGWGAMLVL